MADEKKRIINETTDTALASSGDYVIVDSQTEGTRKFDLGAALAGKVDTVSGKGLSTNDYTTEEKTKLADIATGATNVTVDNTLSNSGQAADAKATGDEITQLKEDLSDIDEAIFIKKTISGTELTINSNSANFAKITSESASTVKHTAKNLIATPYYQGSRTVNGVTFTVLEDGRVHAEGTATSQAVFWIVDNGTANRRPISAGTYTFCGNRSVEYPSGTAWATIGITSPAAEKSSAVNTFTLSADTTYFIKLVVQAGKTVNCDFAPMLESGSSASEWEPYKEEDIALENGQASFELYEGYNHFSSVNTFAVTYYSHTAITKEVIDLSMFGAVGDGVTDDTIAINNALESAENKTLYIPSGTYLFSGTLHVKSGTKLIGSGDSSKFKLANSYSLDRYEWRSDTGGYYQYRYPMIATDADSNGCVLENFALEGQTNAFKDENEDGICIRGNQHVAKNLKLTKINYFPDSFAGRTCITPAWGITVFNADTVTIENCDINECGYECYGVESSENVTIDSCKSGVGNQTSVQIHRNVHHCRIENCTMLRSSSCMTMDADPSTPMSDIHIAHNRIQGVVNFVAGGENEIYITNNNIGDGVNCNNQAYRKKLFLRGNKIGNRVGTYHDECVMSDNIIDVSTGYYMIIHHGNKCIIENNLGVGTITDILITPHDS